MKRSPLSSLLDSDHELTIIAALTDTKRVIGVEGRLPWSLPEDLKRFKALTVGHPIIMGRKTWEFGLGKRTLPHRHNLVVSRSLARNGRGENFAAEDRDDSGILRDGEHADTSFRLVRSLPDAFSFARALAATSVTSQSSPKRIFIIGGASIYAQTLALAHRLEFTLVHDDNVDGDAFFPEYRHLLKEFDCIAQAHQLHTTPPSTYVTYRRRLKA